MDIKRYTTEALMNHVHAAYAKLKPQAEKDGIYKPLEVEFGDGVPRGQEGAFCYADRDGYHYRYEERGVTERHDITQSLFEITYWALESSIHSMAFQYELDHRIYGHDTRRIAFGKMVQLFETIGDDYKKRAELKIKKILEDYPFEDK